jgi:isoquinoline 1-oxidoreductase beta subunit
MIKALDMAAEMSGWGSPLPEGTVRAIALEERGAEGDGHATFSAQVHTISISREGQLNLDRVDIAFDEGFGLVNPLSVKKQLEGQIPWFYNDTMYQECNVENGRIVENNFDKFPLCRIGENPPEINISFFKSEHWNDGMGHDRCVSLQSTIADAIFQITGRRYRDLPFRDHDLSWG